MIKILNASQLASQPPDQTFEGRTVPDKPEWIHIVNLSPYTFEVYDDASVLRTMVPAYLERIQKVRVHSEVYRLTATGTVGTVSVAPPASVYGTVTAPAAGAVIATTPVLPAGTYQVTVEAWYGATADVADNMRLAIDAISTVSQLVVPPAVNGSPVPQTMTVVLSQSNTLQVQAINAGAVGSIYKARIDAVPLILKPTLPPAAFAVYMDLINDEPIPVGVLVP